MPRHNVKDIPFQLSFCAVDKKGKKAKYSINNLFLADFANYRRKTLVCRTLSKKSNMVLLPYNFSFNFLQDFGFFGNFQAMEISNSKN